MKQATPENNKARRMCGPNFPGVVASPQNGTKRRKGGGGGVTQIPKKSCSEVLHVNIQAPSYRTRTHTRYNAHSYDA